MKNIFFLWLLTIPGIILSAYFFRGISIDTYTAVFGSAAFLSITRAILRRLFRVFIVPINIVTLGTFGFLLNGVILLLTGKIIPGLHVGGVLPAFYGAFVISAINMMFAGVIKK